MTDASTCIAVLVIVIILVLLLYNFFFMDNGNVDNMSNLRKDKIWIDRSNDDGRPLVFKGNSMPLPLYDGYSIDSPPIGMPAPLPVSVPLPGPLRGPLPPPPPDPVTVYDVNNIENPLVYPTSRPPSDMFRPMIGNPLFYTPTRGFPDKPAYIGNLIESDKFEEESFTRRGNYRHGHHGRRHWHEYDDHSSVCSEGHGGRCGGVRRDCKDCRDYRQSEYNPQLPSVLQLMGQQRYARSDKYDYYVLLPTAASNPPIKYVIHSHKNEELYDGDCVSVLGKSYTVRKNKSPFEYYSG